MTSNNDNDFGFTTYTADDYIGQHSNPNVQGYEERLKEIELLILPFLEKLYNSGDQSIINWPNRKAILGPKIEKFLKLTRGNGN